MYKRQGVSKAENREQLIAGLEEAARHDRKILVEETIIGHEVECAVLGGGEKPVQSSGVGAVSYTHLDVYKRQGWNGSSGSGRGWYL